MNEPITAPVKYVLCGGYEFSDAWDDATGRRLTRDEITAALNAVEELRLARAAGLAHARMLANAHEQYGEVTYGLENVIAKRDAVDALLSHYEAHPEVLA